MKHLPATLSGPFGLAFALQGRRLVLLAGAVALWLALGAAWTAESVAGTGIALIMYNLVALRFWEESPAGLALDSLPPALSIICFFAILDLGSLATLPLSLGSTLLACFVWLHLPVVPQAGLDSIRTQAERLALRFAREGKPVERILAVYPKNVITPSRGLVLWITNQNTYGIPRESFFLPLGMPVLPPKWDGHAARIESTALDLWRVPTTAHGKLAWEKRIKEAP